MAALNQQPEAVLTSSEVFAHINQRGGAIMQRLQKQLSQPHQHRQLRTWRIAEAATILGVSAQTIRKHETPDGQDRAHPEQAALLGAPNYDAQGQRIYTLPKLTEMRQRLGQYRAKPAGADPAIIASSIFKGGNHKTTTTVNLAGYSALMKGHRVLVIDLDPQGTLTTYYGYRPGFDLLDNEDATVISAMTEDPVSIKSAILPTQWDNIDLIMADSRLEGLDLTLYNPDMNNQKNLGPVFNRLTLALEFIKADYDVILLDCAPNAGSLTYNAVQAANIFLFPLKPDASSVSSLTSFAGILHEVTQYTKPQHCFIRGFLTDMKKNEESNMMRGLIETLLKTPQGSLLLKQTMVNSVELERATNDLSSLYEVEPRGDRKAYRRALHAFNRLSGELYELIENMWGVA